LGISVLGLGLVVSVPALGQDVAIRQWGQPVVVVPRGLEAVSVAIAAGGFHSLRVKADGSMVAWGRNNYGQSNVPAPNGGFVAVAAGDQHNLGLKAHYGDMNCDGVVDFGDSNPFVQLLIGGSGSVPLSAFSHDRIGLA
jgi:hypothetical protein